MLSVYVGYYHEPWSDEAQSWLIARDASITEMIFEIAKYEGTPVLWQIILKIFINLGLEYKYFYLVSVTFSAIGIWIIIYKLKIPNLLKILLPFSYFIFFEYTIKARSYCLILPVLAGIAWIYENRKAHIYLYNILLAVLATICLHASIISGVLYLFEIIEIFKELKENGNIKNCKKELISVIILSLLYIFIIVTVYPPADIYVNVAVTNVEKVENIGVAFLFWFIKVLEALVLDYTALEKSFIPATIFIVLLFISVLKGNKNKKLFLTIFLSVVTFICIVRISNHHIGLMLYALLFGIYLVKNDIPEKNKIMLNILITIMFVIQVVWSVKAATVELKHTYCSGKDVAEYLQTLNYDELNIYATGYYASAITPYFEHNIFDNDRGGKDYYIWSSNNKDWYWSASETYIYPEDTTYRPDIIILHSNEEDEGYSTLVEKVKNTKEYKETFFYGQSIFKGNLDTSEGFYVFERIN